jgi:hypothetical protein
MKDSLFLNIKSSHMRRFIFLSLFIVTYTISCNSAKKSTETLNSQTAPMVPIPGCAAGINTLRAKDAKITVDKNSQLNLAAALEAAAKADVNVTDSLLKSGISGSASGSLIDTLNTYFQIDQSFSKDIWEQTNAFTLTICLINTLKNDPSSSADFKTKMEARLNSMLESQEGYIFNTKKKAQN